MPVKITPLALSLSLAAQPFLLDKLHHDTLAEPQHTHQEPQIPGETIVVSSAAANGTNTASVTYSADAYIGSLVPRQKL
jgi:hypothetical protein